MPTVKVKDLHKALNTKGFLSRHGDHDYFYLYVDGLRTDLRTKISHGEKEIGNTLVSMIRRQMGALTAQEFLSFVECPMSAADYVMLLRNGLVLDPSRVALPVWERRSGTPKASNESR